MNSLGNLTLDLSSSVVTNPTHRSFAQRPPVTAAGAPTLILSSDIYSSSTDVNLTLRVVGTQVSEAYNFAVSQVLLGPEDGEIRQPQMMTPTSRAGEYTLNLQLSAAGHIALVAYPTKRANSRRTLTRNQYLEFKLVSNPICIVATRTRSAERRDLQRTTERHASDLSQSLLAPMRGPSGSTLDPYRMRGMTPTNTRFPAAEQQTARRTVQGALEELSSRLAGFSEFLNSSHVKNELPAVQAVSPQQFLEPYKRYQEALVSGSAVLTSVLDGQQHNPATGNTVSQSLGNQHLTSSQYRLESSSTLDLRSPVLVNSAQVQLVDVRDLHSRAYISQASTTHSWRRSEETDTLVAAAKSEYITNAAYNFSAERQDVTGKHHLYADDLKIQVGLSLPVVPKPPQVDVEVESAEISIDEDVVLPPRNFQLLVENDIVIQNTLGDVSLASTRDLIQASATSTYLSAGTFVSVNSPLVFINCGAIRPPLIPSPPVQHVPMLPIEPLPKATLPAEGSVYDLTSEARLPTPNAGP